MDLTDVTIGLKVRWWVKPALWILGIAAWLGIPFDIPAAAKLLSRGLVSEVK
jgi:hypothetical protein